MEILVIILACLVPIMSITFFIIGYNLHAPKKLFHVEKKHQPTQDELLIEKIANAHY